MASDLERQAKEAFIDDHFELAVDIYTQAIAINPNSAELFADRAQANLKLSNFTDAVADASRAIELDPSMSKAYLRKGTACIKLEEYQTAKAALETGATLAPQDSRFANLMNECDKRIAEENSAVPVQSVEKPSTLVMAPKEESPAPNNFQHTLIMAPKEESPAPNNFQHTLFMAPKEESPAPNNFPNQSVLAPAKSKYRHEFYQKTEEVVVTIFAKKVPANYITVDYGEQILRVSIEIPGEEAYHFQTRLFGKIIPDRCRFEVLSTKIEIRLAKSEPIHWKSLEFSKEIAVARKVDVSSVTGSQRPVYPSSKPKQTDWDKLEAEMKKEEKEEKVDGDAALNKFFREIYGDADEDTRRAMSKSFVESNGTVLSTNWKEVGEKKVQGSAPDGMEMKKWEY